jgi:hypothetical protein
MSLRKELNEILSQMETTPRKEADDALTETDWNTVATNIEKLKEAIRKIRDLPACTIPKGFLYVRFPGRPLPYGVDGVFNWTSELDWKKLHAQYAGDFLRLAGGNASAFNAQSEQVGYDEKARDSENKPNTGGGQMDALQEHKHKTWTFSGIKGSLWRAIEHKICVDYYLSETDPNDGRTDIETRPKNITVEMYLYNPE